MKVYTCTFLGYNPVGACAVIVAHNEYEAALLLNIKLKEMGLHFIDADNDIKELDTTILGPTILLDGEY